MTDLLTPTTGLEDLPGDELDTALPTYAVLVRFLEPAVDRDAALAQVRDRLTARAEPFDDLTASLHPMDGRWVVTARFVIVSLEPHTAVAGLHAALQQDGLDFDEVWADARCA